MFFVFCLIMTENQSKKKVFLSVKQKMTIVEKLQARTSVKMLCREYGVSWDIIHRIRREYKLLSNFGNRGGHILQQKSKKILEWKYKKSFIYVVLTTQATGNPLTDLLLQEKAMEICGQHGSTSFAASRGWLRNFKKRYAIRFREKKVSIDKESTNSWRRK